MTKKVFALDSVPGVQRDGTFFDKNFYTDGRWMRFQRGRPRKMGGYQEITNTLAGPSRGIYVNPQNGFSNVFNGYNNGLQKLPIDANGNGAGISNLTLSGFAPNDNNLWQFDTFTDVSGSGNNLLLAHPGQNLALVDSNVNTPVLSGDLNGTSLSPIGIVTDIVTTSIGSPTGTLAAANPLIGAGQLVISSAFPAGTRVVSNVSGTVTFDHNATSNGPTSVQFDNEIAVSGGVVSLHPYVFVYGNDGLIRNCSAANLQDWVSADANTVNVATGKIVQGLPVRGGSNAPSGLFWSLDSLIRVSFVGGVGTPAQFWRYDLISSQSSIMSSQSVIEYDGIYYWCGIDRFLLYNGAVKEIPNSFNQNYFFDNLNYAQRSKVWVTKVPRYGEIWWFYPRGNATECTDAVIYNIRENCWYDAGEALGARRSAGYFSQVFRFPINADWTPNGTGGVDLFTFTAGSGYTNGTYHNQPLTGGSGTGATATIVVSGGAVTSVTITGYGIDYVVGDVLSASLPAGSNFTMTLTDVKTFISLYQHEIGTDAIRANQALAIESYFETNDLGWVSGGPAQPAQVADNMWLRVERVEPDFVQSGPMDLIVTGRPFAQADDKQSDPYTFFPDTHKIDMREQRREMRLRFISNVEGGDYQLGRIIINADFGDVRPY
jgi:hypothetical protein